MDYLVQGTILYDPVFCWRDDDAMDTFVFDRFTERKDGQYLVMTHKGEQIAQKLYQKNNNHFFKHNGHQVVIDEEHQSALRAKWEKTKRQKNLDYRAEILLNHFRAILKDAACAAEPEIEFDSLTTLLQVIMSAKGQ